MTCRPSRLLVAAAVVLAAVGGGCGGRAASASTSTTVYRWGALATSPPADGGTGSGGAAQDAVDSSAGSPTSGHHDRRGGHQGGGGGDVQVDRTPTEVTGVHGKVVQISTSNSDSYALTSTGTVWAWGAGSGGELGDGRLTASGPAVQVSFPAGTHISSLPDPMPYDGGLAIDSAGNVWGWGNDAYHQLCLSSTTQVDAPQRLPLHDVTLATGAARHTLFDSGGKLEGCGWNKNGDLGDGSTTGFEASPVAVQGLPSGAIRAVTSAWGNEGVLYANGTFYDWGWNRGGQDGDGTTAPQTRAVEVRLPHPATQVSEGGSLGDNGTTLALLDDGSTWVWGDGADGQIGNGAETSALSPTRLGLPSGIRFILVNSGGATCFGLDQQGRLWGWGDNSRGEVGDGSATSTVTRPVDVGQHLTQVSATAGNVAGYLHP